MSEISIGGLNISELRKYSETQEEVLVEKKKIDNSDLLDSFSSDLDLEKAFSEFCQESGVDIRTEDKIKEDEEEKEKRYIDVESFGEEVVTSPISTIEITTEEKSDSYNEINIERDIDFGEDKLEWKNQEFTLDDLKDINLQSDFKNDNDQMYHERNSELDISELLNLENKEEGEIKVDENRDVLNSYKNENDEFNYNNHSERKEDDDILKDLFSDQDNSFEVDPLSDLNLSIKKEEIEMKYNKIPKERSMSTSDESINLADKEIDMILHSIPKVDKLNDFEEDSEWDKLDELKLKLKSLNESEKELNNKLETLSTSSETVQKIETEQIEDINKEKDNTLEIISIEEKEIESTDNSEEINIIETVINSKSEDNLVEDDFSSIIEIENLNKDSEKYEENIIEKNVEEYANDIIIKDIPEDIVNLDNDHKLNLEFTENFIKEKKEIELNEISDEEKKEIELELDTDLISNGWGLENESEFDKPSEEISNLQTQMLDSIKSMFDNASSDSKKLIRIRQIIKRNLSSEDIEIGSLFDFEIDSDMKAILLKEGLGVEQPIGEDNMGKSIVYLMNPPEYTKSKREGYKNFLKDLKDSVEYLLKTTIQPEIRIKDINGVPTITESELEKCFEELGNFTYSLAKNKSYITIDLKL